MKQKNKKLAILLIIASLAVAVFFITILKTEDLDSNQIQFETIKKGNQNSITEKQTRIIKTPEKWSDLWTEMFPTEAIDSGINFKKKMLIAVFQGQKLTGGHSIQIEKIFESSVSMEVFVKEVSPGENCIVTQALTQPYHIVQIDKTSKPINFNFKKETAEC